MSNQPKRRGRPAHLSTHCELPVPPSANALFANAACGRVKTEAYRQWITAAGWELKAQRVRRMAGPVGIMIIAGIPQHRRDLDNILKATADILTSCHVIEDDSRIVELFAKWDRTVPTGRMRLEVRQVMAPQLRPSLEKRMAASRILRARAAVAIQGGAGQ